MNRCTHLLAFARPALGSVRFPDLFTRMHAASKTSTLGLGCIRVGVAISFPSALVIAKCIMVLLFICLTAPIAAHMIGHLRKTDTPQRSLKPSALARRWRSLTSGSLPRLAEALIHREPPPESWPPAGIGDVNYGTACPGTGCSGQQTGTNSSTTTARIKVSRAPVFTKSLNPYFPGP